MTVHIKSTPQCPNINTTWTFTAYGSSFYTYVVSFITFQTISSHISVFHKTFNRFVINSILLPHQIQYNTMCVVWYKWIIVIWRWGGNDKDYIASAFIENDIFFIVIKKLILIFCFLVKICMLLLYVYTHCYRIFSFKFLQYCNANTQCICIEQCLCSSILNSQWIFFGSIMKLHLKIITFW